MVSETGVSDQYVSVWCTPPRYFGDRQSHPPVACYLHGEGTGVRLPCVPFCVFCLLIPKFEIVR